MRVVFSLKITVTKQKQRQSDNPGMNFLRVTNNTSLHKQCILYLTMSHLPNRSISFRHFSIWEKQENVSIMAGK